MTKRAGKSYVQDPHQWYREPRFAVEQVFAHLDMKSEVIWDPCCGGGNILDVASDRRFRVVGTDIVDRPGRAPRHPFAVRDFMKLREFPFRATASRVSIVCNPPYGKVNGVANMGEQFIKHALNEFADKCERMVFVLPIEFMAGQDRFFDIYEKRKPSHSLIHCQRPSMPPGAMVEDLGDAAYKGGMADYVTLAWTGESSEICETIFMRPTVPGKAPPAERRIR